MAEKKRKRNDQGGERPTKKAAFAPQTKIKVELLKNDEALGPLLGAPTLNRHDITVPC
jgi:DNA-directed RNA polymerase I subunit RPA49